MSGVESTERKDHDECEVGRLGSGLQAPAGYGKLTNACNTVEERPF
jgi:hypothetical protein